MKKKTKKPAEYENHVLCDGCGYDITSPNSNISNSYNSEELPDLCDLCVEYIFKKYKKTPYTITHVVKWNCFGCSKEFIGRDTGPKCGACMAEILAETKKPASYPMVNIYDKI